MNDDLPKDYDASFLRDITDIVKNKTLFFIPFFGAYMAFLVGKPDYLKSANPAIWAICTIIFFVSVRYIHLVSQLLWATENCRLLFNIRRMGVDVLPNEKEKKAVAEVMRKIPLMASTEDWWFRKVMLLFYVGTFCVLQDLFLGDVINKPLAATLHRWFLQ